MSNPTSLPFFDSTAAIKNLQVVAMSWVGTRFFAHGKLKGAGVDCVHLCAEIYRECGLWRNYEFPRYTIDGGHHAGTSKIIEWVERSGRFHRDFCVGPDARLNSARVRPGDLLCFKIGRVEWHVGLQVDETKFIHCWQKTGVILSLLADSTYFSRITAFYRPLVQCCDHATI